MKAAALAVLGLVLVAFLVMPVMAANADNNLYTSKYAATPQYAEKYGSIQGNLRAGFTVAGTVTLTEVASGNVTILAVGDDGKFEATDLTPGQYILSLADGNGGQPEQATVMVRAGYIANPMSELLGHAIPPALVEEKDVIVILEATYGMTKVVIDQAYVPEVPGVPAVTHQEYEAGHVHAKKVGGFSSHDFWYNGHKYQIVGNQAETAFIVHGYFCAHLAQMVTIVDVPAIPAVPAIPEVSHVEGAYADVTAEVQAAVDMTYRTFKFNNAMNPGGIVNEPQDLVLVVIADPAYGQVKNVMIKYTINGVEKTIDTMEYETINL